MHLAVGGEEDWEPLEALIQGYDRLVQAAFLAARGEERLARLALERPEYLRDFWQRGLDSLLDGTRWDKRGTARRRIGDPRSAA